MNFIKRIKSTDGYKLAPIILAAIAIVLSIIVPWYFHKISMENTALDIQQLRIDVYSLEKTNFK